MTNESSFETETSNWQFEINNGDINESLHNQKLKDICTKYNRMDYYATWAIF